MLLFFSELIILGEMGVQMGFELFISDEAHAAIGALKFDTFIQFCNSYDIKFKKVKIKKVTYSFKACGQFFKVLKLNNYSLFLPRWLA